MKRLVLLCIVLLLSSNVNAAERISGEVSGVLQRGEYVIDGTLYVPEGETLRITPGTQLYFEQFSGITVFGILHCDGEAENTILLTSINEKPAREESTSPEPFDWNGIEITTQAEFVSIAYTKIRHSTFGINIRSDATKIVIENAAFFNNGYTSIAREDKMVAVQPGVPIVTSWNVDNTKGGTTNHYNDIPKGSNRKNNRTVFYRVGSATLGAGGVALFTVASMYRSTYGDYYQNTTHSARAAYYKDKYAKSRSAQITGAVCAALAVLGFGVTFTF